MKQNRKILVALLLVLTLMMGGVMAISASAADGGTTIYFQNNWLWSDVRCYCFSGETQVGDAFPGASMTKVGTDAEGYDVYSFVVPAGTTGIIISGFKDTDPTVRDQTPDITSGITEGAGWKNVWNGANAVESYSYNPNSKFVISSMTVAGDSIAVFGTAWDNGNKSNDMTLNADGLYEKVYEGVAAGSYMFKCVANYSWGSCWGDPNSGDKDGNYIITITEDNATLTITFNPETYEVKATTHKHSYTTVDTATCTEDGIATSTCGCGHVVEVVTSKIGHNYVDGTCANCGGAEPAEHVHVYSWEITTPATCTAEGVKTYTCSCNDSYTEAVTILEHKYVFGNCTVCKAEDPNYVVDYYLVGYINGEDSWVNLNPDYKFVDGTLVVSFLSDSYVFIKTGDNQKYYQPGAPINDGSGAVLYHVPEVGYETKVFVPGGVEVEFTLVKDGSDLVLSYIAEEPIYTVAGSAGLCGTEWDVESFDNEMYILEDGTYELVLTGISAGSYEFKIVKNNAWENGAWGADGGEANFVLVVAENNSLVNINFNPVTKAIIAQATGVPEENPGDDVPGDDVPGDDVPGDDVPGDNTPDDESGAEEPAPKLNFFQKIWKAIVDFFMNLFGKRKK